MNYVVTNFSEILSFAKSYGLDETKKRAILREFLQVKFLSRLYGYKETIKLSFVGGTSLRLLRGIDRFSEDLDFDNLGLSAEDIQALIKGVIEEFEKEDINVELYSKKAGEEFFYELRFPSLLHALNISTNYREKLMIKVDYSNFWKNQKTEAVLLNKYGFLENIVTNASSQIMVQKLQAYIGRKQTQPRDIYDIVWIYSRGIKPDYNFAKENNLGDIVKKARDKFETDKENVGEYKTRLAPYLFDSGETRKLKLFDAVLRDL